MIVHIALFFTGQISYQPSKVQSRHFSELGGLSIVGVLISPSCGFQLWDAGQKCDRQKSEYCVSEDQGIGAVRASAQSVELPPYLSDRVGLSKE